MYRVRIMPDEEGHWTFSTSSDAASLDGHAGEFDCLPARVGDHGPVRVHDRFHFRYADGTRYLPVGTTGYAWTHQPEPLQERALASLAGGRRRRAGSRHRPAAEPVGRADRWRG